MEKTIIDPVFGEISYDHSWEKSENVSLWGKDHSLRVVARAYNSDSINDRQRAAYTEYKANALEYEQQIPGALLDYYKANYDDITAMVELPDRYKLENITKEDVIRLIKVKTLFFETDGRYGYLCDCIWDREHGIAILCEHTNGDTYVRITDQDELI